MSDQSSTPRDADEHGDHTDLPSDPTAAPDTFESTGSTGATEATEAIEVPARSESDVPPPPPAPSWQAPSGFDAPPAPDATSPSHATGAPEPQRAPEPERAPDPAAYPPAYPAPTPPPPAANPYGGYTQAPPASAQYGQVQVGSLPYVEHHFGPVTNFGDRIVPSLIDGALMLLGFIPMIIGFIVMAASSSSGGYDDYGNYQSGSTSGAGVAVGLTFLFLGFLAFFGIWLWNRVLRMGRTGQSVGKKVVGQKLINATTGEPIGAGQSFIREVIHGLANQVVYLSYLWMLWDPNRQTLGDMVAKSTVIKVPKG